MTDEVKNALLGKEGARQIRFRFDVLRGGAVTRSIGASGTISVDSNAEIKRSGRFTVYEELDMIQDQIRPVILLKVLQKKHQVDIRNWATADRAGMAVEEWDGLGLTWNQIEDDSVAIQPRAFWEEFPLGVYLPRTYELSERDGRTSWEIEAYDRTILLKEDCMRERAFVPAGTNYLDAVQSILVSSGIGLVMVTDETGAVLPADREFEIGVSKLEVINTLLQEINFSSISCDEDGRVIISRFIEPSADRVDFTYLDDDLSIIMAESTSTIDILAVPNVFVAVCDNPDLDQTFRAEWVNDNVASPVSIINRGANVAIYRPDMIASQQEIEDYVKRIAFEANQIYETVQIETAINPLHGISNTISVRKGELSGVFIEAGWSFELRAGATMKHTVKRMVTI